MMETQGVLFAKNERGKRENVHTGSLKKGCLYRGEDFIGGAWWGRGCCRSHPLKRGKLRREKEGRTERGGRGVKKGKRHFRWRRENGLEGRKPARTEIRGKKKMLKKDLGSGHF